MKILGLQKMTLLDFPGRIACTVFLGGCNFRCPFCHNGSLAIGSGEEVMGLDEFFAFLDSRRGRLHGVCVSGGEPTIHPDLPEFLGEIKNRGYEVKLDTNGTNPEMLLSLINDCLVDYVAMDIKNSPEKYEDSVVLNSDLLDGVACSAKILMEGRVDFEFRTTMMRELQDAEDMERIGRWLAGEEKYFLQSYRDEGDLLVGGFTPHTQDEREALLGVLQKYIPRAKWR